MLREHRHKQLEECMLVGPAYNDSGLVFATPVGTAIDPSNVRRTWMRITKAVHVGRLRFHDLRHAHASLMLGQGTHVKIVGERLGHGRVGITLDLYSHVLPSLQAQAAADVETLFSEAKTRAVLEEVLANRWQSRFSTVSAARLERRFRI